MPNRWIKEAYLASSRINAASPEARDMWIRLLVVADDYGLFHANPQLVASRCFPLNPNARKCAQLLAELEAVHLVSRYEVDGRPYLRIEQWYERARAGPKYPLPANNCAQMQTNADTQSEQMKAPTGTPYNHDHDHDHDIGARARDQKKPATVVLTEPTAEHRTLAIELRLDVEREFESYHDHFKATGKRHRDEAAGFRNWLRRAQQYGAGSKSGRAGKTLAEQRAEGYDAICAMGEKRNGRDITGNAERVDSAVVHALPIDLRQQGGNDVGQGGSSGPLANVG